MALYIGIAICLTSGLMFNYQLLNLNRYLKQHHENLWRLFGGGNTKLHFFAKFYRIRKLAVEYTSEDPTLNQKLKVLSALNWGIGLGALIIIFSVAMWF